METETSLALDKGWTGEVAPSLVICNSIMKQAFLQWDLRQGFTCPDYHGYDRYWVQQFHDVNIDGSFYLSSSTWRYLITVKNEVWIGAR